MRDVENKNMRDIKNKDFQSNVNQTEELADNVKLKYPKHRSRNVNMSDKKFGSSPAGRSACGIVQKDFDSGKKMVFLLVYNIQLHNL